MAITNIDCVIARRSIPIKKYVSIPNVPAKRKIRLTIYLLLPDSAREGKLLCHSENKKLNIKLKEHSQLKQVYYTIVVMLTCNSCISCTQLLTQGPFFHSNTYLLQTELADAATTKLILRLVIEPSADVVQPCNICLVIIL